MPFARGPVLSYIGLGQYVTVGSTEYVGTDDVITIPDGFGTDLATVPRIFWAWIPPQGAYERAAVLHDWLCADLAQYHGNPQRWTPPQVNARDTDGLFRRVMREAGVAAITRWTMWAGVRWGALANPARRHGWWRDATLVLAITAACLTVVVVTTWGVDRLAHSLLT